tara:strand:- start:679 stop:1221 length:543 start_codon:yes stop_codon:yes gene_type:complete
MQIHHHHISSPAQISYCTLEIPSNYLQECIKEAYNLGDSMNNATNLQASMSTYTVWEETNQFNLAFDKIMDTIKLIFPIKDSRYQYNLDNAWSAIFKKGNSAKSHNHHPSSISWVYYLKTTNNSSPLIFPDCQNLQIFPSNSLLVLFPSYLNHYVPEQTVNEDRICLVGNMGWKWIGTDS